MRKFRQAGVMIMAGGALLLAGCAPSIEGKWTGSVPAATTSIQANMEFKKDKTFTQTATIPMIGTQIQIDGTYTVEGDKVSMNTSKIMAGGQDVTSKMPPQIKNSMNRSGTFKVEGDTLTLSDGKGQPATFQRVKE